MGEDTLDPLASLPEDVLLASLPIVLSLVLLKDDPLPPDPPKPPLPNELPKSPKPDPKPAKGEPDVVGAAVFAVLLLDVPDSGVALGAALPPGPPRPPLPNELPKSPKLDPKPANGGADAEGAAVPDAFEPPEEKFLAPPKPLKRESKRSRPAANRASDDAGDGVLGVVMPDGPVPLAVPVLVGAESAALPA